MVGVTDALVDGDAQTPRQRPLYAEPNSYVEGVISLVTVSLHDHFTH